MTKKPIIFVRHVLECIDLINDHIKGFTKKDFLNDVKSQDAIMRRIEIIGEALKNMPDGIKEKYKEVDWQKAVGMRNVLIHDYFGVSLDITWEVAKKDIKVLKKQMLKVKKDLEKG